MSAARVTERPAAVEADTDGGKPIHIALWRGPGPGPDRFLCGAPNVGDDCGEWTPSNTDSATCAVCRARARNPDRWVPR